MKKLTLTLLITLSSQAFAGGGAPAEEVTVIGDCPADVRDEIETYNSIIPMFTKRSEGDDIILASLLRDYSFVDTYYHKDVVFIGGNGLPSSILNGLASLPEPLNDAANAIINNAEIKRREGVKLFFKVAFSAGGSLDTIDMSTCKEMSDGSYIDKGATYISYKDSPLPFIIPDEMKCNDYTATWVSGDNGFLQVGRDVVHSTSVNCN